MTGLVHDRGEQRKVTAAARDATPRQLRRISTSGPLRIGVLVSATGANLQTLLAMQYAIPAAFEVCLVVSHGARSKALEVARHHGVESWPGDFDNRCGMASHASNDRERAEYRARARAWHDDLNVRLAEWETANGEFDLIVLAYHRWIQGDLLERFRYRIINQHPGDLSLLSQAGVRVLIGKDPVRLALRLGHPITRTSCFLVDEGQDSGPVICRGPPVPTAGRQPTDVETLTQEMLQKKISDRPCLEWAVRAFAAGSLALATVRHPDGSPVVLVDGVATPLGGRILNHSAI